jgi:16S rRNA (adenine1518-N6/adenine1519-N6)-dimethyltransferase
MEHFYKKKSLGQHFLNDAGIARRIAEAGKVVPGDMVLEIGPGTGNLTAPLLSLGATVIAVEADARAISELEVRFSGEIASKRLVIHHGDIRELSFESLGLSQGNFKIISNIPYYISGLLFRIALGSPIQPNMVVFLVQKEVAERIARSEKESLLSLSVKIYGDPTYCFTVKRGSFTPPPAVDSAVIAIEGVSRARLGSLSDEAFFEALRIGFGSRRKQLFGLLRAHHPEAALREAFSTLSIPITIRGEDLRVTTWVALAHTLTSVATLSTQNSKKEPV